MSQNIPENDSLRHCWVQNSRIFFWIKWQFLQVDFTFSWWWNDTIFANPVGNCVNNQTPGVSWAQECLSLNKSITTLVIFHYCSSQWRILTLLVLLLSGIWDTTGNLPPQFIVIYPKNAVIIKLKGIDEKYSEFLICVIF